MGILYLPFYWGLGGSWFRSSFFSEGLKGPPRPDDAFIRHYAYAVGDIRDLSSLLGALGKSFFFFFFFFFKFLGTITPKKQHKKLKKQHKNLRNSIRTSFLLGF